MAPTSIAGIKHSPAPSQLNRIPHTKVLFTLVPMIPYVMPGFQQKITRYAERQGKTQSDKHQSQTRV